MCCRVVTYRPAIARSDGHLTSRPVATAKSSGVATGSKVRITRKLVAVYIDAKRDDDFFAFFHSIPSRIIAS